MADQVKDDTNNNTVETKGNVKVKKTKVNKVAKNVIADVSSTKTAEQTLAALANSSDQFSKLINANLNDTAKSAESIVATIAEKVGNKRKNVSSAVTATGDEVSEDSKAKHSCHHCKVLLVFHYLYFIYYRIIKVLLF